MTEAVTVPCLREQTFKGFTWVVAVDRHDPTLEERMSLFRSSGVKVEFLMCGTGTRNRDQAAAELYNLPWGQATGPHDEVTLTTRLDDDDGITPDFLQRLSDRATKAEVDGRGCWMFPHGYRVWGRHQTAVEHNTNAWATMQTPPGDRTHCYTFRHRVVKRHVKVRVVDRQPAWLWVRHDDTLSGWKQAAQPVDDSLRALFPVDWPYVEGQPAGKPRPGGERFQ